MNAASSFKTTVDVRKLAPRDRHPLIFSSFAELGAGEALQLVNDHDPKPLFYQFQAELPDTFSWDYIENGPEVWKVRIGKLDIALATQVSSGSGCTCSP